jgi:hypothetical protein
LDADDIWLPEYLQTIYELIQNFPDAGLYATAYKKRKANGEESAINIQALPAKEYVGLIPNYFESVVKGENLVWTSATCIPKKVFIENDIWFPVGEKYGEDQYVWARVAMKFDIAYDTKACSVYKVEAENNTAEAISKEREPHQSFLMLKDFRDTIKDSQKMNYFDEYIEKKIFRFIILRMTSGHKLDAIKQPFRYKLSSKFLVGSIVLFLIPLWFYPLLKKSKQKLKRY